MIGHLREARGHRHAGGVRVAPCGLGEERERHVVAAAIAAVVVSALATAYASYSQSQAQAAAASYQKRLLNYQAQVAAQQREAALQAGKVAEANQREQDQRMIAAQRARIGATGAEETFGSPLLTEMESAANAELNARRIRWTTETQAKGITAQEQMYKAEAVGQGFAAQQYRRQGYIQAGAALLTGAARAYGTYASYQGGSGGGAGQPLNQNDYVYIQQR